MEQRIAELSADRNGYNIRGNLHLDGEGRCEARTGDDHLDHFLTKFAQFGNYDIQIAAEEREGRDRTGPDRARICGEALGKAVREALGDLSEYNHLFGSLKEYYNPLMPLQGNSSIASFLNSSYQIDLNEGEATATLQFREEPDVDVQLRFEREGGFPPEAISVLEDLIRSFAIGAKVSLELDVQKGRPDYNRAMVALKALAVALRLAIGKVRLHPGDQR